MSTITLNPSRAQADVIDNIAVNQIVDALISDFVGRQASGAPVSGNNLGTATFPWGTVYTSGIVLNGQTIDTNGVLPGTRIISGAKYGTTTRPAFLSAAGGSTATANLLGASVNVSLSITGNPLTLTIDSAYTSLSLAPSSNNTCVINDATVAGQWATKLIGEQCVGMSGDGIDAQRRRIPGITIGTVGTGITALVGTWQYFKVVNSVGLTEIFYAYIFSSTQLVYLKRGLCNLGSTNVSGGTQYQSRLALSNGNTITLLKATYLFVTYVSSSSYTLDTTTKRPIISPTAPASPATGDYWYQMPTRTQESGLWWRWSGSAWVIKTSILMGVGICDSAGCQWVEPEPFYQTHNSANTIEFTEISAQIFGAATIEARWQGYCYVNGYRVVNNLGQMIWAISSVMSDTNNAQITTGDPVYLYLDEIGQTYISASPPREVDYRGGRYHPDFPMRCVGMAVWNGNSNFQGVSSFAKPHCQIQVNAPNGFGSTNTAIRRYSTITLNSGGNAYYVDSSTLGATFTIYEAGLYAVAINDCKTSGNPKAGLSLNSNQLTTSVDSITPISCIIDFGITSGNLHAKGFQTLWLVPGDVVRPHIDGSNDKTDTLFKTSLQRVL